MKTLLFGFAILISVEVFGQSAREYAVEIEAEVVGGNIHLKWRSDISANNYLLYRKTKDGSSWGSFIANIPGGDSSFVDTAVQLGVEYEYKITKMASGHTGYGYVSSGAEVAADEYRGRIIVIIDSTHKNFLFSGLEQLKLDLIGDGWTPVYLYTSRQEQVANLKALIESLHLQHQDLEALLLIGQVPVPYSGNIAPDGHTNNHQGAWPADGYYGSFGNWTDVSVNITTATGSRNDNVPGDGKFDQSVFPADVELQIGRIDFSDLPNFASSEAELLRQYLQRNHQYRHKLIVPDYRGLIDDNFGGFNGEAFAATGWKNFAPLVGLGNTTAEDYRTTLSGSSRIWSYGCGAGSFTSCSGVGNSVSFAGDSLQAIFTMIFGSYFGDWDNSNA